MMKHLMIAVAAAVISLAATQAKADGLELIKGRVTHENGYTRIVLGLKNNTDHVIKVASVECGFFQNSELASNGNAFFIDVQPGQTAYSDVLVSEEKVTRIDCRLLSGESVPEHAIADSASCQRAVAALTKMPEVEVLDDSRERAAHFAYKPGGGIRLDCTAENEGQKGTRIYLIMGVSPLPGPEFWPFFGRLARVVGVEPSEAIKAAQACRTSGERKKAKWQKPNENGLFAGDLVETPTLHVNCRVGDNFLSLGVFKPPGE
jgi:hypothetical protein